VDDKRQPSRPDRPSGDYRRSSEAEAAGCEDAGMTAKDVVARWVELFNAGNADGLAALYHDDAINHQVPEAAVEGRAAIRDMFRREFAAAEMICIPEVIHEAGDVAILEWRDPLGLRGCGFFTVHEGRIAFQRGYWDKLSFLRLHGLPLPPE
jgi:limonene-1,2-epoxide hydrolase